MSSSKEVFKLRKEGKFPEALAMARECMAKAPDDPWNIRAFGWSLHDHLKLLADDASAHKQMVALFAELDALQIPADDTLLTGQRETWRRQMPADDGQPSAFTLNRQAWIASRRGDHAHALAVYREALRRFPEDTQLARGLGWEILHHLKELLNTPNPTEQAVRNLLVEYHGLPSHERPSQLHSMILFRAAQAAEKGLFPSFIKFFRWWDPANLREEDFNAYRPDEKREFPGCVAHVIRAINQTAKKLNDPALVGWAAEFVGNHLERFPDEEWFPYYYGKLLARSGHPQEARNKIMPIVRRKKNEFWAWDCLADTCRSGEIDLRIACLCRALQCSIKDDSFRVRVRADLGLLLAQQGLFPEARYEVAAALEIRKSKQWPVPASIRVCTQQPWFLDASAIESNEMLYAKYAPLAESLVMDSLPETDAVLSGYSPETDQRPASHLVAFRENDQIREIWVKSRRFPQLEEMNPGAPLAIRLELDAQRPLILTIRERSGEPWDVFPRRIGVLSQDNPSKRVRVATLSRDDVYILPYDRFQSLAGIPVGSSIAVAFRRDTRHERDVPVHIGITAEKPSRSFCMTYTGTFEQRVGNLFGFVQPTSIYCAPHLVAESGAATGDKVEGVAVMEKNPKKNIYSWRAITLATQPRPRLHK